MKNLIALFMSIVLLMSSISVVSAETDDIIGLHEKLNAIILENNFTEEQIADMDAQFVEYFNKHWSGKLEGYKALGKMKTDSDEAEYEYRLNYERPDFSKGIKTTFLSNLKYIREYANQKKFTFLFEKEYWTVATYSNVGAFEWFDLSGNRVAHKPENIEYSSMLIRHKDIEFIKNEEHIKELLLAENESFVNEIKVFSISSTNVLLYIQCKENEYLVKLYSGTGWEECMEEFQEYKLYPLNRVIQKISEKKEYICQEKNTFETEALSLQEKGLLQGNENGLDLLKPLTRIEAATMLLRAMGESTESEAATQTFSDVPQSHWGYGAAENAYSLGLIQGVGNEMFAPDEPVTSVQFATMILRAGNHTDFNWEEALDILINEGILSQEDTVAMDLFTRGDMAKIIYESMENGMF